MKKTKPITPPAPNRDEEAEMRAIEAFLRSHDPARRGHAGFPEKKRRRVLWSMRHPLLGKLLIYHRLTALLSAVGIVALVILVACSWYVLRIRKVYTIGLFDDPFRSPPAELEKEPLQNPIPALPNYPLPANVDDPDPDSLEPNPDEEDPAR